MIVGFDHDGPATFAAHREFVRQSRVMHVMVAMLSAIPKTPLHKRLAAEGRLHSDEARFGTNVVPLRMTPEELRDGYVRLMQDLYEPRDYFARFEELYLESPFCFGRARAAYRRRHPWVWLKGRTTEIVRSMALFRRLVRAPVPAGLRREYRRRLLRVLAKRPDPAVVFVFLLKCATHYHHRMAEEMARGASPVVNPF
jgi:uncharacterized protein YbgA (DUF1722 family)